MTDYAMIDSFYIDNGELDGFEKHECFVLGVEWCQVIRTVDDNPDDNQYFIVHAANQSRLDTALRTRGRKLRWVWPVDDQSEEWISLYVDAEDMSDD